MRKIICPNCGEVDYYTNFEIQKIRIAFDADGDEVDVPFEVTGIRSSIVNRCPWCEKKVKIVER